MDMTEIRDAVLDTGDDGFADTVVITSAADGSTQSVAAVVDRDPVEPVEVEDGEGLPMRVVMDVSADVSVARGDTVALDGLDFRVETEPVTTMGGMQRVVCERWAKIETSRPGSRIRR